MKKENGISLIKICIIVAIIFIVATICAFIFKESKEKENLNRFISQMEIIQEKVNKVRNEYKIWEKYDPNESGNFYMYLQNLNYSNANDSTNPYIEEFNKIIEVIDKSDVDYWNSNIDTIITNYCYFSPEDLKKSFGLENIDTSVIINFYTGNVISKNGIKEEGNILYRQYDCKSGNKLVATQIFNSEYCPKFEIVENFGLSKRVKISLDNEINSNIMDIYYYSSKTDENKKLCSKLNGYIHNKDENAIYFNIEKSGDYTFIVEDTNFIQYPKIECQFNLCNPPKLLDGMIGIYWDDNGIETRILNDNDSRWYDYSQNDFKMANAKTKDGSYWVWIPRFTYKKTSEGTDIEFLSGKTDIATNNKSMNGYKVNTAFSEDGEITGFWMAKFQGNIKDNELYFKPGQTLGVYKLNSLKNKYKTFFDIKSGNYCDIMSNKELDAALLLAESIEKNISNNLVHYAGGSPNVDGFKECIQYSSSNNIYGVYDLLTCENEITKNSKDNDVGRFRLIIKSK